MGEYLTRAAILGMDDREYEDVPCPEWGGTVRIRSLTAAEYEDWESEIISGRGAKKDVKLKGMRFKLIQRCAVDEQGVLLFSESDLSQLNRKNAKPIDRLFGACQRLVGTTDEDLQELVQDFEETPNSSSNSD